MELQPDKQVQMDKMRAVLAETYARYGFTPLDTPAIERPWIFRKYGILSLFFFVLW